PRRRWGERRRHGPPCATTNRSLMRLRTTRASGNSFTCTRGWYPVPLGACAEPSLLRRALRRWEQRPGGDHRAPGVDEQPQQPADDHYAAVKREGAVPLSAALKTQALHVVGERAE